MTQKNFIELLGRDGAMRKHFVDQNNGAEWVHQIYDELVTQLRENYTYFPLADEREMGAWINHLDQHPRCAGMSMFRTADGWQVSLAVDTPTNMLVIVRPVLIDAIYTAFNEFNNATATPVANG